jgi:hypothetical protein
VEEVEAVLRDPASNDGISRTSGQPMTFGYTPTGRYIAVIWEEINKDPRTIYPVTAYDVPEPKWRRS